MSGQITMVDLTKQSSGLAGDLPLFKLGTRYVDDLGNTYRYVKANGAKTVALFYGIDDSWVLQGAVDSTLVASGLTVRVGLAQIALTDTYYGWVQTAGAMTVTINEAITAKAKLYCPATGADSGKVSDTSTTTAIYVGLTSYAGTASTSGTITAYCSNELVSAYGPANS